MKINTQTAQFARLERIHVDIVAEIERDVLAIEHILAPMVAGDPDSPTPIQDRADSALASEVLRRVHRANHNGRRACILGRRISAHEARKAPATANSHR